MGVKNKFNATVKSNTKILDVLKIMTSKNNKDIAGFAVIIDKFNNVIGSVTDGDIRRSIIKGISSDNKIIKVANKKPFTLVNNPKFSREDLIKIYLKNKDYKIPSNKLIIVDNKNKFLDVVKINVEKYKNKSEQCIAIYGLGFVGLTLAVSFAKNGIKVIGIDNNEKVIKSLKKEVPHFYEEGLESLMQTVKKSNPIIFKNSSNDVIVDTHIICVGTPVNKDKSPNYKYIKSVIKSIIPILKKNDLVIFRSTLPIGSVRKICIPLLEKSGLKSGVDFGVAFAPERTVEGDALREIENLPQIIGGVDENSVSNCINIFKNVAKSIVEVNSLEEAELVKLMNNTFRDLIFSFSNEISYLCEDFNINATNIIKAANNGYPRDKIPYPSPGVGGACLSKDPYLFSNPIETKNIPQLGIMSRKINNYAIDNIYKKIKYFAKINKISMNKLRVIIVGIAFKGFPETSDIRDSSSVDLINKFKYKENIAIMDFVASNSILSSLGLKIISNNLENAVAKSDAIIFMNNHKNNLKQNIVKKLSSINRPYLFYDGWNMFDPKEIESIENVFYSTLGYISNKK